MFSNSFFNLAVQSDGDGHQGWLSPDEAAHVLPALWEHREAVFPGAESALSHPLEVSRSALMHSKVKLSLELQTLPVTTRFVSNTPFCHSVHGLETLLFSLQVEKLLIVGGGYIFVIYFYHCNIVNNIIV